MGARSRHVEIVALDLLERTGPLPDLEALLRPLLLQVVREVVESRVEHVLCFVDLFIFPLYVCIVFLLFEYFLLQITWKRV